ncbi:hypothetical protein BI347_19030 [Chromobacterium sphagni]|uniref:Uncharacterized protein n=1 Tax=Chromobacterium sphagni TaxID=1903179 RepID=A0A1S1WS29_9NEIS|nr:hypothetical protein [Chromobacterium sphagni]OHX10060.1 hypothetical protein BI347_22380 [Chromobacterium sphagni]OHX10625.1 hypothetical protein BI347_19030 [Chromobacterium sphagni]
MHYLHLTRDLAHCLNPMIGSSTRETLENLASLLKGHCSLIADRSNGTTLDGESTFHLLQAVAATLLFESEAPPTAANDSKPT